MLDKIHIGHMGIEKCKSRARQLVYWPLINTHISDMVKQCTICQQFQKSNCKEPLKSHEIPNRPWQNIATDLFSWNQCNYLIIVDYYSNYFELEKMHSTTSKCIIEKMKRVFSTHGIPNKVVSDNGPQFRSQEFINFANKYDFIHKTSSPIYPKSNGFSEKYVSVAKNMLRKCHQNSQDIYLALLEYRNTPIKGDYSPSQLLMSRNLRSVLPIKETLLNPRVVNKKHVRTFIKEKQDYQKKYHDRNAKALKPLKKNDKVYIQTENHSDWKPAIVKEANPDERSYVAETDQGQVYKRNRIHLNTAPQPKGQENDNFEKPLEAPVPSNTNEGHQTTRSGRLIKPPQRFSP